MSGLDTIYKIDDGETFEGTLLMFRDTFFDNANESTIVEYCRLKGWKLEIVTVRQRIEATIEDSVLDLLDYGRRSDEDLPYGAIEAAVKAGVITVDEMVLCFRRELEESLAESEEHDDGP